MDIQDLKPFVLTIVLVGMILGVGILILGYFGDAAKQSTTVINETSIAFVAGVGSVANDDVTSVTYVGNNTVDCTTFNVPTWCANWTTAGAITLNLSTFPGGTGNINVSYVYDADTTTTTATTNINTALSAISTTWLSLIITIFVLAIILGLVIRSFAGAR